MASNAREEKPMTAVAEPEVIVQTISGHVPVGFLTAADLPNIDLDVPFEIQDGDLSIMPPPSVWHADAAHHIQNYLGPRFPYSISDVQVAIGDNVRRPDVVGLTVSREELLRARANTLSVYDIAVAVEIISHNPHAAKDRIAVARDRRRKFVEYAAVGIPEYWIVDEIPDDPMDASVEIYRLVAGAYDQVRVVRLSELLSEA
jgi:Uma2 family endonuclease